ncbi:class I SAM-dependent methyltransferase [Niallia sp. Krafla_26]|uniref:class I SAM-dependent methyltransferase n=1 Tax=Niallia sp. Krafla_26 TaxID=3064703 RepID=UPI003D17E6C2
MSDGKKCKVPGTLHFFTVDHWFEVPLLIFDWNHFYKKVVMLSFMENDSRKRKGHVHMAFYHDLSTYYDQIFPLNQTAYAFISNCFQKGDSIIDMGAGTGNMAIALAQGGLQVTASEPEETLVESIKKKAAEKGISLSVHTKTMEKLGEFQENFDGILCVGNTLPHLPNIVEVERFLGQCYEKLKENGKLILQQVNYDKVLAKDDFSFPVIEKENFTFTRHYEKKNEHIHFTSRLTIDGETIDNTIPLYPITSQQLKQALEKVGFQNINQYGNFKEENHTSESPALVTVARK